MRLSDFKKTIQVFFIGAFFAFFIFLFPNFQPASAAITEVGPPMLGFHENITAGGGSIIPLSKFILMGDGSTALTKIGVILRASSTMTVLEQINGIALYRESGSKPNFQPNEDIYMNGTFQLNPATSTLHTLQLTGSGYVVPASNTEFYVVASTTGIANIVNGNAFEVVMQNNYASTSPASALGTALIPGNKITLRKNVPVKISEVKIGSTGNDRDEFIELYNPNPYYIDIQASGLALHTFAATSVATNRSLTFNPMRKIMPKYGFFLISSAYNYSGTEPSDATFDNSVANFLVVNGGFSIATSTSAASATSTAIDKVGWESQPAGNCENSATAGTACVNTTPDFAEDGSSIERLANTGSTNATMAMGGADQFKGNGLDSDDNSAEFVLQTVSKPQNTLNAEEFPHGGGGGDTVAPFVNGSYPSTGSTGVPIDLSFIGFGFNEPVEPGTIGSTSATTTVTLVRSGTIPSVTNNLCASVSYNQNPTSYEPGVKCNLTASLLANTSYIFEVGTTTGSGIRDMAGNVLDQNSYQAGNQSYQATFTVSATSQTMTNNTPPQITGSTPYMGAFGIPSNISKFFITFSQTMNATTLSDTTIKLYSGSFSTRVAVSLASATFSYNASTSVLTISSLPSLSANTHYELEIDGNDGGGDNTGVKSSNSIMMQNPGYVIAFDTGSSDTTAPQVLGIMPVSPNQANVPLNNVSLTVIFNDHIDASTATSGAVTLGISGGAAVPADVSYDSASKELSLTARNLLPAGQNMLLTVKGASIRNISNTLLGTDYLMPFSTEGSNSDSAVPSVTAVNADEFGIAVTFNEAVNSSDAANLSNYSVVYTPSGGSQQTLSLSAMAGHTITYNASRRTAKITGIYLPPSASFTVTATNIRDISANTMTSSSGSGTTLSSSASGGFIDPGMSGGMTGSFQGGSTFTMGGGGGGGFMPPAKIMAMNSFVSASSTYGFEIPISTRIPANGQIVLTFPSTSDFGVCCAASSSASMKMMNDMNRDINGPGTGTIGIKTIARDTTAKTVTLTLDTATRSENSDTHDFLKFMLTDIKNPSIAKGPDSSGYAIDIKTKSSDGSTILESSFSVNPVYIGGGAIAGGATTTIRGQILSGYGGAVGLNGVSVMLSSSILGQMPQSVTTAQSGATHGYYEFTNLPANNDYFLFTAPTVSPTNGNGTATTTGYFGFTEPSPIRATSTSIVHRNLTLTATTSAVSLTIRLTASASTFTAGEQVDIFAGGSSQFSTQTVTLGVGAYTNATITTLSLPQQNGSWFVGLGPMMPKDGSMMGPPPSVNWAMPKPLDLDMSGCPDACVLTYNGTQKTTHTFTISSADKTISGIVKDASGTVIASAMVYAYSPSQMMGNNTQSDSSGKFSLNIVQGQYNVGAFFPGMGQSKEVSVEVVSGSGASTVYYIDGSKIASTGQTGANPFIITIKRPSYKITGKVSDGASSIANAAVFTYRTDGPGGADAMTDSSGNYTLYVDNGTWKVNARVPGYGAMAEQTVTISGADQSNINFAPSGATTYWTITGTVFESADSTIDSGEGISNARVMARNSSGMFETKTGSDGVYTLRVAEGNSYTLEAFKPGYGRIPSVNESLTAIAAFNVTGTTTKHIRVNTRQNVTINIKDASGNAISVSKASIDLFDVSKNFGNHAEIENGTTTVIQLPNGASTTVRVFIPSVPQNSITVASDNGAGTLVLNDSNNNPVLQVNGAEIIKIVVNTNLRAISGTIYHTSAASGNELKDTWVEVVDTSTGTHYGMSATSSAGVYSINLADGTYKIAAMKFGYTMSPQSLTVSGNATQNLVMTLANLTISGTITAGGSVAPNAFVRAEKVGGGSAVTQAEADGTYSLKVDSGNWRIFAASDKYTEGAYASNPLTVSVSQTGINITLSSAANIQSKLATSETFKDTSSGTFEDSTVNVKVSVDSGGLGQAGSESYLTAKETVNYPDTSSVNVIANKAKDISAYSGGSQVKNLSSGKKAEVELTYTVAELATSGIDTPAEVSKLQVSTVNEQRQWEGLETVATYEDSSGNAVSVATTSSSIPVSVATVTFKTTQATHFSPYALTEANNPSAPGTPSGVTATAANAGTASISLSWTANPTDDNVTGYYIYRDTASNPNSPLLTNTASVAYTDTGLAFGTTYYYRIAAYRNTLESAASTEVSATPTVVQGGGSVSIGSSGGGGGSAPVVPPQTVSTQTAATTVKEKVLEEKEMPLPKAKPSLKALSVSPVFNRLLKLGVINLDVKRLQQILNSDPDTAVALKGIGSKGKETTKFGAATQRALQKFQEKYKIAKKGDTGYGTLGPATRAKIKELFQKDEVSKKEVVKTKTKIKAKTTLKAKTKVKVKTKVKIKVEPKTNQTQAELEQKLKELQDKLKAAQY